MQRRIPLIRQLVKMVKGCESLSPPKGYQGPGRKPVAGYMATVGNRPGPCWGLDDFETTRQEFRRNNLCHVTSMLCGISVHEMASWWTNCSKIDPTVTTTWNVARLIFENKMQIDPNTTGHMCVHLVSQNGFTKRFWHWSLSTHALCVSSREPPASNNKEIATHCGVKGWSADELEWCSVQSFEKSMLASHPNLWSENLESWSEPRIDLQSEACPVKSRWTAGFSDKMLQIVLAF